MSVWWWIPLFVMIVAVGFGLYTSYRIIIKGVDMCNTLQSSSPSSTVVTYNASVIPTDSLVQGMGSLGPINDYTSTLGFSLNDGVYLDPLFMTALPINTDNVTEDKCRTACHNEVECDVYSWQKSTTTCHGLQVPSDPKFDTVIASRTSTNGTDRLMTNTGTAGNTISTDYTSADVAGCTKTCDANPACQFASFDKTLNACQLKGGQANTDYSTGYKVSRTTT